jgi:hypothetical protein
MNHNLSGHFKQWFQVSRTQLDEIRASRETAPVEVQLTQLRQQYSRMAHILRVCQGKAYFVGVPRITLNN